MSVITDKPIMDFEDLQKEYQDSTTVVKRFEDSVEFLVEHFTFLHGSDCVWDAVNGRMMKMSHLALSAPMASKIWKSMPERKIADITDVVFDPAGTQAGKINLFAGIDTQPKAGDCGPLLELALMLCNGDEALCAYMLRWIAYPLQHIGAKMATSIIMRGPSGTGKNILWHCLRDIYGKYGKTITQNEVESQYNGHFSATLFIVADEVISNSSKWHLQGLLKSIVTGDTIPIREMYQPMRIERNYCNIVFLSNSRVPLLVDDDDRRYTVVESKTPLSKAYYAELCEIIHNGGREAFYHYLLNLDLGDFSPHSPPYDTAERDALKRLSMTSAKAFAKEWLAGESCYPLQAVLKSSLYDAYKAWCATNGERATSNAHFFREFSGFIEETRPFRPYTKERFQLIIPPGCVEDWDSIDAFRDRVDDELARLARRRL